MPRGKAAVLVTSRIPIIPFFAEYPRLEPKEFTDREAFDLFTRFGVKAPEDSARKLFAKLGHLPIAISVAAGLIRNDVRHSVESMLAKLPPLKFGGKNVDRLFREAIAALSENERTLLVAMAACAPAGVRVQFAAEVRRIE